MFESLLTRFGSLYIQTTPVAIDTVINQATAGFIPLWISESLISLGIIFLAWMAFWLFHRYGFNYVLRH